MSTKKRSTKKTLETSLATTAASETVAALDLTATLGELSATSLEVTGTLSRIQESLVAKGQVVAALDRTIEARREELARLHDANEILLSIDELRAKYDAEAAQFAERAQQEHRRWEQQVAENQEAERRRSEAAKYAEEQRQATEQRRWEQHQHELQVAARDAEVERQRNWTKREEILRTQEDELKTLRERAVTFEATIQARVNEAVGAATSRQKREYESERRVLEAEHKAALQVADGKITALTERVQAAAAQLAEEREKLIKLQAMIETISVKSIEAASDRKLAADLTTVIGRSTNGDAGKRITQRD